MDKLQQAKLELAKRELAKRQDSPKLFNNDTIEGKVGNFLTQGTQKFGKTFGESLALPRNEKMYEDSLKLHTDTMDKLSKDIQIKKNIGKDTSKLEEALHDYAQNTPKIEDFTGNVINKTNQEVLGEAAGVLPEILAGGAIERAKGLGLVKTATQSAEEAYKAKQAYDKLSKGAKLLEFAKKSAQLAKTTGGLGYAMDVSEGLKKNEGTNAFMPGVNTAMGVATAPVSELISPAISRTKRLFSKSATEVANKNFDEALRIARPDMAVVEKQAIEEGGDRIGKRGVFTASKISPSKYETPMVEAVQELIDNGQMPLKDKTGQIKALNQRTSQLNQGLDNLVLDHNEPFNKKELDTVLEKTKEKNRILFGGDSNVEKAYDVVINEFKNNFLKKNNVKGLQDARKEFGNFIENNFKKAFGQDALLASTNPRYQALRDIYGTVNNFSADLLDRAPSQTNAGKVLTDMLRKEHYLLTAKNNIASKMKGYTVPGGKAGAVARSSQFKSGRNLAGAARTVGAIGGIGTLGYLFGKKGN